MSEEEIRNEMLEGSQEYFNIYCTARFMSLCYMLKEKGILTDEDIKIMDNKIIPDATNRLIEMTVKKILENQKGETNENN